MLIDKEKLEVLLGNKISEGVKKFGKDFEPFVLEILCIAKQLNPEPIQVKQSRIIPLSKWNEYHDYPTVGAMRQLYFKRKDNGFDYCTEKGGLHGGTILINEDKYFEWRTNQQAS